MYVFDFFAGRRRCAALRAATLLACGAAALAQAPPAHAVGAYVHAIDCAPPGSPSSGLWGAASTVDGGWRPHLPSPAITGTIAQNACGTNGLVASLHSTTAQPIPADAWSGFRYEPPADTRIVGASFDLTGDLMAPNSGRQGSVSAVVSRGYGLAFMAGTGPINGLVNVRSPSLDDQWLDVRLYCAANGAACPGTSDAGWVGVFNPAMTLGDDVPPVVGAVSGSARDDVTWKAGKTLTYAATDQGGGIARFRLYLDGVLVTEHAAQGAGATCAVQGTKDGVWQFGFPRPCAASVDEVESIDTTTLADGQHTVTAKTVDAGQREATIFSATRLIANHPPVNAAAPKFENAVLATTPRTGQPLVISGHGTWSGPSLTFVEGWERCDGNGSSCAQIPGADTLAYTPTAADVGHTLRYAVTATNPADSVNARSNLTGVVTTPSSAGGPVLQDPANGGNGGMGGNGGAGTTTVVVPGLPAVGTTHTEHVLIGHVAGEPQGATCPQDKATLVFQHVRGARMMLRYGKASTAQVELTCSANGKAIADAKLEIATKTGGEPAVAADVTTDGAGHATLRLAKGASRGVVVGYRMYADDALARATATLKVLVLGRVAIKASRTRLRNGQAVTLRGALAGGHVPRRGVNLAVQWRDGKRWRPFAQIKTDRKGRFRYAYKFTRTSRAVVYRLRVQVLRGQVDYPYEAAASKTVRVTVAP